jgi:hypothetical protein
VAESLDTLPSDSRVLVLRGDCLYDARALRGIVKSPQAVLEVEIEGQSAPWLRTCAAIKSQRLPAGWTVDRGRLAPRASPTVTLDEIAKNYEAGLKKLDRPFVLLVTGERRLALERLTFSGAYKGVTDLVTKWLWPVPARWSRGGASAMGITPNQVTLRVSCWS